MGEVGGYCDTTLNYADGLEPRAVPVTIRDGRAALADLDYERCGFTLLGHESAVENWFDIDLVQKVHGPEVEALARDFLGCDRAVAYPPIIRSPRTESEHQDYGVIEFVHSDYSDDYRAMVTEPGRVYRAFLEPLLAGSGLSYADVQRAGRVAVLQLWRNLGAEYPDYPIAFCDAESVPRAQVHPFLVSEYAGMKLEFETLSVEKPSDPADNRWYTFAGLTRSEVVAFRTYDSRAADEGRPFWTPHSAFRDPNAGPDAPRRESLEMRVLCLFG